MILVSLGGSPSPHQQITSVSNEAVFLWKNTYTCMHASQVSHIMELWMYDEEYDIANFRGVKKYIVSKNKQITEQPFPGASRGAGKQKHLANL